MKTYKWSFYDRNKHCLQWGDTLWDSQGLLGVYEDMNTLTNDITFEHKSGIPLGKVYI
jgi:hypothetical protein